MKHTDKLFHLLYQKTRMLTKEHNETLQKHEIFSSQWSIIYCLKINGPMTQSDIWRYLVVEAPTVTRTLMKLEESGWVRRTPGSDKRERLVSLTEKAIEQLPMIEKDVRSFEHRMLENLSEVEQDQLFSLLSKLGIAAREKEE
jgi:MarR family transcriptional regulator, transcriptional regulator for hemolysin